MPDHRRTLARALCLPLLVASCTEPRRDVRAPAPREPSPAATPPSSAEPLPTPAPGSTPVVDARPEPLPYQLIAIDGTNAALAVSDAADEPAAYVQRVGAAAPSPAVALPGHHPAYAWDDEGATLVASTRGRALCSTRLDAEGAHPIACQDDVRADAVVRVGRDLLLVAADPEEPDEDEDGSKATRRVSSRRGAEAKSRSKRTRGRDVGRGSEVLKRRTLEIVTRTLAIDGTLSDEPSPSEVTFDEPMAGMGLVGAGRRTTRDGASERIDLLFYEWAGPIRDRKAKAVGRARFGVAVLDERGTFVEGSRGKLGESDLYFGFLGDAVEPRLVTGALGSVMLAQGSARGPCQATVVTPARAPMLPDRDACAFDPERFVLRAAELRRGSAKNGAARAPSTLEASEPAFRAVAATLSAGAARRAPDQPAWDAPRVVASGGRAYTITSSGDLRAVDRATYEITTLPRPLVARRARAYEAAIAPDGEALIRTHDGIRVVTAGGAVRHVTDGAYPGPQRPDARAPGGAPFAKIGATWWTTRGAPRRLVPDAAELAPVPAASSIEASVLVGGRERGLLIEVDGVALTISTVDPSGRATVLTRSASPVRAGIDAAARDDGGALLVGPTYGDARTWTAVAIDPDGRYAHGVIGERTRAAVPRLTAVGGRGAHLQLGDEASPRLLLDRTGTVKGTWSPRAPDAAPCIDGVRWPSRVPSPRPGAFVDVPALARPGACVVGQPSWGEDGVLRLVVSRYVGPHASVELARFEPPGGPDPGSAAAAAAGGKKAEPPPPQGPARCPADMVFVDGRYCVDRFEASIAERASGRLASPDFPITPNLFASALGEWATKRERVGDLQARAFPLPRAATFQHEGVSDPIATSRSGVLPSGYLTGLVAREVCVAAGKRLCTKSEFETACKGDRRTRFPYGDTYREGACNVARPGHPAAILHGHASVGHLDPRLGRVVLDETGPGLRATGGTPSCASRWGGDAIYDMVGNLDEWVDEKGGAFAGGFYARGTKSGCSALVDSHPASYLDYSTGVRCCRDAD